MKSNICVQFSFESPNSTQHNINILCILYEYDIIIRMSTLNSIPKQIINILISYYLMSFTCS